MTDVSLVGNDDVTFTFAPGEVQEVRSQSSGEIDVQKIFGSGPAGAFAIDFNGVEKVISIRGFLFQTDTTRTSSGVTTSILQQKQWLEKQLNGNQVPRSFTSNYESQSYGSGQYEDTKVLMSQIQFTERAGRPDELQFSAQLLVGSG